MPGETILDWVAQQHQLLERQAPLRIHSQAGDRDDWGVTHQGIRGLPFTRAFESYLDTQLPPTPALRALRQMAKGSRLEYQIARSLLVWGRQEAEVRAEHAALSPARFSRALHSALILLREKTRHLAGESCACGFLAGQEGLSSGRPIGVRFLPAAG